MGSPKLENATGDLVRTWGLAWLESIDYNQGFLDGEGLGETLAWVRGGGNVFQVDINRRSAGAPEDEVRLRSRVRRQVAGWEG